MIETAEITCPTCGESYEVALPPEWEMPTEMDSDCEICCRPLVIVFTSEGVWARGIGE